MWEIKPTIKSSDPVPPSQGHGREDHVHRSTIAMQIYYPKEMEAFKDGLKWVVEQADNHDRVQQLNLNVLQNGS